MVLAGDEDSEMNKNVLSPLEKLPVRRGEEETETFKQSVLLQSCPIFSDPTDCSPPGSSVHGDSPGTNTGVGCHALLRGTLPNSPETEPASLNQSLTLAGGFFTISATWEAPSSIPT